MSNSGKPLSFIQPVAAEDTWPIRHEVMWPDHPFEFVKVERDTTDGLHYGLFLREEGKEARLVSIVSLFVDGDAAQFRKLATLNEEQGKGYGSQLLHYLIEEVCKPKGIKRFWCNARKEKSTYYERFGLGLTDQTYVKGGIDFVVMERKM